MLCVGFCGLNIRTSFCNKRCHQYCLDFTLPVLTVLSDLKTDPGHVITEYTHLKNFLPE